MFRFNLFIDLFEDLLKELVKHNILNRPDTKEDFNSEISRMVAISTYKQLLGLAATPRVPDNVKGKVLFAINSVKNYNRIQLDGFLPDYERSLYLQMNALTQQYEQHPELFKIAEPLPMPDGPPIGDDIFDF